MQGEWLRQALDDYAALADKQSDPELSAVMAALFLEDVTGVVMLDEEIEAKALGDPGCTWQLLESKGWTP